MHLAAARYVPRSSASKIRYAAANDGRGAPSTHQSNFCTITPQHSHVHINLKPYSQAQFLRHVSVTMYAQVLPQITKQVTFMLVRHLEVDCLGRILESQLTPEFKFKVALGKLQQQQPLIAELLKLHIEVLKGRCPLTSPAMDVAAESDLELALQHPEVE
jgi:hypothetical protein